MEEKKKSLKRVGPPRLVVECENITTLLAVAKVVNECGLNAKVQMDYDIYGGCDEAKKDRTSGSSC